MTEYDLLLRLFVALVLGGLVGIERQQLHKPAGVRTYMLVCLGSCLFTLISFMAFTDLQQFYFEPTRIAAGVVTGIGFLGAGAIIQSQKKVLGLTTAASIWVVAAIGMAVGYGLFILAGGASLLSVIALYFLEKMGDGHNSQDDQSEN